MSPADILSISQEAIYVLLKVAGPLLLVSLVTGLVIAFVQALTQIQEMTLTFVPKIIVTFGLLLFLSPFISKTLNSYMDQIFNMIVKAG